MAKDELFACIECGKEFATKKAVEKIANLMKPKLVMMRIKSKHFIAVQIARQK